MPATPRFPVLATPHLVLRLPEEADAPAIVRYYDANRAHLSPWEPARPPGFYTETYWRRQIAFAHDEFTQDRSCRLFLFDGAAAKRGQSVVIGNVGIANIVRGIAHMGTLGYGLGATEQGKGLMFEALQAVLPYAFGDLRLHRIGANYIPRNERSGKLLRRLGFVVEGYARDYLRINGRWEDHVLTGLTNPDWRDGEP